MMIKSGFVPDTLEDYDEFDDWVWTDRDTEISRRKYQDQTLGS
jgi:hypothetical protein